MKFYNCILFHLKTFSRDILNSYKCAIYIINEVFKIFYLIIKYNIIILNNYTILLGKF